jgi:hypothetical protein
MKICPIMSQGWLANKFSVSAWSFSNLPKCLENQCAIWDESNRQCSNKTQSSGGLVLSEPVVKITSDKKEADEADCWMSCKLWSEAEQYRSRVLTGSIGLEGTWSDWIDGRPAQLEMNREYQYRRS